MDDEKYDAMLERYDDEEFHRECKAIEAVFEVEDIESTLLIEELDRIQIAMYRVLMKKYLSGDVVPSKSAAVIRDFKVVSR
jgi:hypothetical protein